MVTALTKYCVDEGIGNGYRQKILPEVLNPTITSKHLLSQEQCGSVRNNWILYWISVDGLLRGVPSEFKCWLKESNP